MDFELFEIQDLPDDNGLVNVIRVRDKRIYLQFPGCSSNETIRAVHRFLVAHGVYSADDGAKMHLYPTNYVDPYGFQDCSYLLNFYSTCYEIQEHAKSISGQLSAKLVELASKTEHIESLQQQLSSHQVHTKRIARIGKSIDNTITPELLHTVIGGLRPGHGHPIVNAEREMMRELGMVDNPVNHQMIATHLTPKSDHGDEEVIEGADEETEGDVDDLEESEEMSDEDSEHTSDREFLDDNSESEEDQSFGEDDFSNEEPVSEEFSEKIDEESDEEDSSEVLESSQDSSEDLVAKYKIADDAISSDGETTPDEKYNLDAIKSSVANRQPVNVIQTPSPSPPKESTKSRGARGRPRGRGRGRGSRGKK